MILYILIILFLLSRVQVVEHFNELKVKNLIESKYYSFYRLGERIKNNSLNDLRNVLLKEISELEKITNNAILKSESMDKIAKNHYINNSMLDLQEQYVKSLKNVYSLFNADKCDIYNAMKPYTIENCYDYMTNIISKELLNGLQKIKNRNYINYLEDKYGDYGTKIAELNNQKNKILKMKLNTMNTITKKYNELLDKLDGQLQHNDLLDGGVKSRIKSYSRNAVNLINSGGVFLEEKLDNLMKKMRFSI